MQEQPGLVEGPSLDDDDDEEAEEEEPMGGSVGKDGCYNLITRVRFPGPHEMEGKSF